MSTQRPPRIARPALVPAPEASPEPDAQPTKTGVRAGASTYRPSYSGYSSYRPSRR